MNNQSHVDVTYSKAKCIQSPIPLAACGGTDPYELKTGSFMGVVQCRKNLGDISVPAG